MTVLLLDSYNLLFRAYATLPRSIADRDGLPLNAVYGMVGALLRLLRDVGATGMVAAFDDPTTPTFRHTLFPAYQAQRGPMGGEHADDFSRQVELARTFLPTIGIPALTLPGFEADDIMATLAGTAGPDRQVVVVSTDRDLLQIVRPGVSVLVPGKTPRRYSTEEEVRERLGVGPAGVTTWKALAGDPSDNIPGVRGIGDKTAAALVTQFGNLDELYANLSELKPATRRALDEQRADAYLFLQLVTVRDDLRVPLSLEALPPLGFTGDAGIGSLLAPLNYGRNPGETNETNQEP